MFAHKILVVEDEKLLALDIRNRLQNLGYIVTQVTDSGTEAIQKVAEIQPNLVLIDICLAGEVNGIKVADIIENNFQIPILYLTEYSEYIKLQKQQLSKSCHYLLKPFAETDLHIAIEMAIEQYKINSKLQEDKQKMAAIVNSMACGVVVTYTDGHIQMMNPMAETLTGWKQDEVLGKNLAEVISLVDKDMDEVIENLAAQAMENGEVLNLPENCTLIAKDGVEIAIGDHIAPIRDRNGNITGAVLVFQDITQRKQAEIQLLRNAFYDGLTALPNRVLFLDR